MTSENNIKVKIKFQCAEYPAANSKFYPTQLNCFKTASNVVTWSLCKICVHYIFKTYSRFLCPVSLHNNRKSWIDALEDCQTEHFSLVEICEKKVWDDVKSLQNKTDSKTGVWIGLQRSIFGYSPEWKWISGYNVVNSQLNRTSSANFDFDNHCGKVIFGNKTEEMKWSNADCHEKLPYICQSKLLFCCPIRLLHLIFIKSYYFCFFFFFSRNEWKTLYWWLYREVRYICQNVF